VASLQLRPSSGRNYVCSEVSNYIMGKKKASYTAEFKLKVILYADENGK
jgi:hypothetical protein